MPATSCPSCYSHFYTFSLVLSLLSLCTQYKHVAHTHTHTYMWSTHSSVLKLKWFSRFFSLLCRSFRTPSLSSCVRKKKGEPRLTRETSLHEETKRVDVVLFSTSGWLFSAISSKRPLTHLLTHSRSVFLSVSFWSKEWFLFNFHSHFEVESLKESILLQPKHKHTCNAMRCAWVSYFQTSCVYTRSHSSCTHKGQIQPK